MTGTAASFSCKMEGERGTCTHKHQSLFCVTAPKRTSGRPFVTYACQLPAEPATHCAHAQICAAPHVHVQMITSLLPQALCVSTEASELGEYFLLPSERSLSEWQMDGLPTSKKHTFTVRHHPSTDNCTNKGQLLYHFSFITRGTDMWRVIQSWSWWTATLTQKLSCWIF